MKTLVILSLLVLVGCGPTLKLAPNYDKKDSSRYVAVLPIKAETDVPKTHLENLRNRLIAELRNEDYLVLSDTLVFEACGGEACEDVSSLLETYNLSGAFQLTVTDYGHIGFLLGFYTTVGGKLELINTDQTSVVEVEHQESKRGGILFDSGQLFTAISEQIKSGSDEEKENLGDRFVRRVVSELPNPEGTMTRYKAPVIRNAAIERLPKLGRTRFCLSADNSALTWVRIGKLEADLRPQSKTRHCAVYSDELIENANDCSVSFIASTQFGDSARKTLTNGACDA